MKQIYKTTFLHQAAKKGNAKEVKKLIKEKAIDINAQDEQGNTALKLASQGNGLLGEEDSDEKPKIVEILLSAGANPNIADEDDDYPLFMACSWSNNKIFEKIAFLLLEAKADIHKTNKKGQNALHFCAPRSEKLCLELINRGIDVNALDKNNIPTFYYAIINSENEKLLSILLQKVENTKAIEQLISQHHNISSTIMKAWYCYAIKQNKLTSKQIAISIKKKPLSVNSWLKVCALYDVCIETKQLNLALDFDKNLTKEQLQIGHLHKYYPIYKIMLYMQNNDKELLDHMLFEAIVYSETYRYSNNNWRDKWKYISDEQWENLNKKTEEVYHKVLSKFYFKDYYSYKTYPIETRPFIWLEKTSLNKVKEKCALTGNKLSKGNTVYKFKNINKFGCFSNDFFYANQVAFEASSQAMQNKRNFEQNTYELKEFAFYWIMETNPIVRNFWYSIESFNLEQTLKLLSHPISSSSSFKHRYGKYMNGEGLVKREYEYFYHKGNLFENTSKSYLNIWHALIKCGYIDQIINQLPQLPEYIPYLLLCFDIQEVKEKTEAYLQIEGVSYIIDLALKSYAHKNEEDLKQIIQFSLKHPKAVKEISNLLNTYELHLYNVYAPTIDWYCKAFAHFSYAKGAGLLDLLIPYPKLLQPLSLLLKYGGELTEINYSDSEIFFIRTIIFYTTLFNGQDIVRLFKSLSNDKDGQVYFSGINKKVYDKTYKINQKLVQINWQIY